MNLNDPDIKVTKLNNPQYKMPFFGDWLDFLVDRGHAFKDGNGKTTVLPDVSNAFIDGLDIKVPCLACGKHCDMLTGTNIITIGCLVSSVKKTIVNPWEIEVEYVVRPMMKTGLACQGCFWLYMDAVKATVKLNDQRLELATKLAAGTTLLTKAMHATGSSQGAIEALKVPCLKHRMPYCAACNKPLPKATPVKLPAMLTAWLDVSEAVKGIAKANRQAFKDSQKEVA